MYFIDRPLHGCAVIWLMLKAKIYACLHELHSICLRFAPICLLRFFIFLMFLFISFHHLYLPIPFVFILICQWYFLIRARCAHTCKPRINWLCWFYDFTVFNIFPFMLRWSESRTQPQPFSRKLKENTCTYMRSIMWTYTIIKHCTIWMRCVYGEKIHLVLYVNVHFR